MRLFLAIDVPASAQKKLVDQLTDLQKKYPQFTWTIPENFHITIHFFGEVTRVPELKKKVVDAIYDMESFHLYAFNVELFMHRKIIVYVGFNREKELEKLVEKINAEFLTNESERFVPHLTVARTRIPSKQQYLALKSRLEKIEVDIDFPVKKIYLYESLLGGKNPVYKKIHTFKLLDE